jgi:hypothetical protein
LNTNHLTAEEITNHILNGAIEKLEGRELVRYVNSLVSDIENRIEYAYYDGYETARGEFACECDC